MKERPGFDRFLRRLESLGIKYSVSSVSAELYNLAQLCISSWHVSPGESANSSFEKGYRFNHIDILNRKSTDHSPDCSISDFVVNAPGNNSTASIAEKNLIKTDKNAFVVLTITN